MYFNAALCRRVGEERKRGHERLRKGRSKREKGGRSEGVSEVRRAAPQSSNREILTGGVLRDGNSNVNILHASFVSSYLLLSSLFGNV